MGQKLSSHHGSTHCLRPTSVCLSILYRSSGWRVGSTFWIVFVDGIFRDALSHDFDTALLQSQL